jgi:hypothetical protein
LGVGGWVGGVHAIDCVFFSIPSVKANIEGALAAHLATVQAQAEAAGALLDLHVDMPRSPPLLASSHAGHASAQTRVSHAPQSHSQG